MPSTVLISTGFDEVGMRNRDRMQDAFERFPPKLKESPRSRETWLEVVVPPDVALQRDVRRGHAVPIYLLKFP
jgi:hypothetical protein